MSREYIDAEYVDSDWTLVKRMRKWNDSPASFFTLLDFYLIKMTIIQASQDAQYFVYSNTLLISSVSVLLVAVTIGLYRSSNFWGDYLHIYISIMSADIFRSSSQIFSNKLQGITQFVKNLY